MHNHYVINSPHPHLSSDLELFLYHQAAGGWWHAGILHHSSSCSSLPHPPSSVTSHQSPVCILYHQSPAPFLSISSISLQFAFVPCHLLRTFSSATTTTCCYLLLLLVLLVLAGCNSLVFLCPSSLPPLHVALLPFFLTLLSSITRACSCNFLQQHSGCRY